MDTREEFCAISSSSGLIDYVTVYWMQIVIVSELSTCTDVWNRVAGFTTKRVNGASGVMRSKQVNGE